MTDNEYRKLWAWHACGQLFNGLFKRDSEGWWIRWHDYGQLTAYGWEIDHVVPLALGGPDEWYNLRARHWHPNRRAGGHLNKMLQVPSSSNGLANALMRGYPRLKGI
jgi:hypothetical protein